MRATMLAAPRPPAIANRFSRSTLAVTLLVALLACAGGAAVAWREPSTPAGHQGAHRSQPSSVAPTTQVLPDGSQVVGAIAAVDQETGAIRINVGAESYVYTMSYRTLFPDPCLTRANLHPGQMVRLVLPWYLSGTVSIAAIVPTHGCNAPGAGTIATHTDDSPPGGAH